MSDTAGHMRHVFGAQQVDADESYTKVEGGEHDVDPEGIPAV